MDLVDIVEIGDQALANIFPGLLSRFSQMHGAHNPEAVAIHLAPILPGYFTSDIPVVLQRPIGTAIRAEAQHAKVMLASQHRSRWRQDAGDDDFRIGLRIGTKLTLRLHQIVPVRFLGHDLTAKQPHDNLE